MSVDAAMDHILLRSNNEVHALIIHSKASAALMMSVRDDRNGKRYNVWSNLESKEAAIETAKKTKGPKHQVVFAYEEVDKIPENIASSICSRFLLNFY